MQQVFSIELIIWLKIVVFAKDLYRTRADIEPDGFGGFNKLVVRNFVFLFDFAF
jgi:hypothetical protein